MKELIVALDLLALVLLVLAAIYMSAAYRYITDKPEKWWQRWCK